MSKTILITGSNRGIGLELCRQYAMSDWIVYAFCRQPQNAPELSQLALDHSNIHIHALDVLNDSQMKQSAHDLKDVPIDILFANAGVYGQGDAYLGNINSDKWLECLRINTMAPLKLVECFSSNISRSKLKTIAVMSSKMGSMADNSSGGSYVYRSSKAALNAVMVSAAIDLKPQGIKLALLHPGWVQTDMGGSNAEISVSQSVTQLRSILTNLTLDLSGSFFDIDGSIIPW